MYMRSLANSAPTNETLKIELFNDSYLLEFEELYSYDLTKHVQSNFIEEDDITTLIERSEKSLSTHSKSLDHRYE